MSEEKRDDTRSSADDDRPPAPRVWWRLLVLLVAVLVAIIAARSSHTRIRGPSSSTTVRSQPAAEAVGGTVSLTIRFGDGKERTFGDVPWRPDMTVDDLLSDVSQRPDGILYVVVGKREMMLVTGIDKTANDNHAGRFWTYSVNDKLADRSAGIYELQPGDRVLWTFGQKQ